MRRHVAWVALVAVVTAGCGVRPTGVISGGPAPIGRVDGVALYFLADSSLTPVLRPMRMRPGVSPTEALALLQHGPNGEERAANLTSEVPAGLDPVTVTTGASGDVEVVVSADVGGLSTAAVDQIVCTVRDALAVPSMPPSPPTGASSSPTEAPATAPSPQSLSITLASDAATRGPRTCPLTAR